MSEVKISEVKTKHQLNEFIGFPLKLYRKSPFYVPPLLSEEKNQWNPETNPALQFCDFRLYIAEAQGRTVGRIALMLNKTEKEPKIRFGSIDFKDKPEISRALLQKATDFAVENNISKIEGPMGFTNLDKAGMLTFGFDKLATMAGIYNYDYYPTHLENLGYKKEKEWVEYEIEFPEQLPEKVLKFNSLIMEKYRLKVLKFRSKKEILPYVKPMFRLLDETYRGLSTYIPITEEQIKTYEEKYFGFLKKDFIIGITDDRNELIAFAITMPSYSKALQKAKGKLFPFGWFHLLNAGAGNNDRANFYLIGIHPDYQKRGVTSIIFKEMHDVFKKKGIRFLETNPELEENMHIQLLWRDYNPTNHKRRKTYSVTI